MAEGYEDVYDLDSMDDAEVRDLIRQQFEEYPEFDAQRIEITVEDGFVTLSGRVGTEMELQRAEAIVADVLGIKEFSNELVIDELTRGELSEAADEAVAQDSEATDVMGGGGEQTEPSAEHLLEDTETELYGTQDMGDAIEQGKSYNPPDRPTQMGTRSVENH